MVWAQDPLGVGEAALEQRDGLIQPPGDPVCTSEVAAGGQGAGVVRAQDPLGVGEAALKQRDGLIQPPGFPVGDSEVAAGGQGVGVVRAQDPLGVGDQVRAVFDGLGGTIAEGGQAPARPAAQPQQGSGQRGLWSENGTSARQAAAPGGAPAPPRTGRYGSVWWLGLLA